jgi:hypothetical protein
MCCLGEVQETLSAEEDLSFEYEEIEIVPPEKEI